jgi:hypothetical protein
MGRTETLKTHSAQEPAMKNHIPTQAPEIFYNSDDNAFWLEIACGIASNGAPYKAVTDRAILDMDFLSTASDEEGFAYMAKEVSAFSQKHGVYRVSAALREALPVGFEIQPEAPKAPAKKSPKAVMIRAWQIARAAAAKFGGKVREFFSESLKQAWAE